MDTDLELSTRVQNRLEDLRYRGRFADDEAAAKACRLVETVHGADNSDEHIVLQWLVDEARFIRDVRWESPATGLDLVALDLLAELCVGITVQQAARIMPAHVQERLRLVYEQQEVPLPWQADVPFLVLIKAAKATREVFGDEQERPSDWNDLGLFERVRRLEAVLDQHIRPMLASDGGGVDLVDLRDDEIIVQYHGACGSCSAAFGGTLEFMQGTLNEQLGVELKITVQGLETEPFLDL